MDIPEEFLKPRLCMLKKLETFAGYGFNLHAEKGKVGQFIGKVDPNSPAAFGGLLPNDILIEVNGINVEDATHQTVVGRVKSLSDRVDLFVCSPETYRHCQQRGISLSSAMRGIERHATPDHQQQHQQQHQQREAPAAVAGELHEIEQRKENRPPPSTVRDSPLTLSTRPQPAQGAAAAAAAAPSASDPVGGVSLAEMRARIGQNRRNQVKMSAVSFSEKYNVFQSL